jgi:eukaryotic-like serine/threonine-protein kinase
VGPAELSVGFTGSSAPLAIPSRGDRVYLEAAGAEGVVGDLLGQGGQGIVFSLVAPEVGSDLALKWYFPRSATPTQRMALEALVERGSPNDHFLWPLDLAGPLQGATDGFGYVMARRPPHFAGLADLMSRRVDAPFRTLLTLGLELSHAFLVLHNEGLCYRDISFGNVFFDPATGSVLVCDNDNVGVDGESVSLVRGTPYFMAPEVVRGEGLPSSRTDLWSLAVLLFYVLLVSHPLEGARTLERSEWDEAAMREIFGEHPVFVFDPNDDSNRPVPGLHDNALIFWDLYPQFLRDLFVQAFTRGVQDPRNGRVQESVWRAAMARLRDSIVYCQQCGRQNLYDEVTPVRSCWSCGTTISVPPRLRFGRSVVVLNHDATVTAHHLTRNYDFATKVAEVCENPDYPGEWGLRNLGTEAWWVAFNDGSAMIVDPTRAAPLIAGAEIDFGTIRATVEA